MVLQTPGRTDRSGLQYVSSIPVLFSDLARQLTLGVKRKREEHLEKFDFFRQLHKATQQVRSIIVRRVGIDCRRFALDRWRNDDGGRSDIRIRLV